MNCVDCGFWRGNCAKGKLNATALSGACDEFEKRKPVLAEYAEKREVKPKPTLRTFGRQECQGCMYKGKSYCWNQCPYNLWKKQDDW